jgi:hypothetical protein
VRPIATLLILASAIAVPSLCPAQAVPDQLVVIGAGFVGDWDTEIQLADSPLATRPHART